MSIATDHAPRKTLTTMTASSLAAKELPKQRWAVPGLIPEGFTILAAKPKIGKSWLMLGISLAVASGQPALGQYQTPNGGEVLYLALEDNERRLQSRLGMLCPGGPPSSLHLATAEQCPTADDGGIDALSSFLDGCPACRLVVIDTLAKFRPRRRGSDVYADDYRAIGEIKSIADQRGIAIVAVHHVRKAQSEDSFDGISGTNGLTGAADTMMVLDRCRGRADAVLRITGRDIEEQEIGLTRDQETQSWLASVNVNVNVNGHSVHTLPISASSERARIYDAICSRGPMTPAQVSSAIGVKPAAVRKLMSLMAKDGQIKRGEKGRYSA